MIKNIPARFSKDDILTQAGQPPVVVKTEPITVPEVQTAKVVIEEKAVVTPAPVSTPVPVTKPTETEAKKGSHLLVGGKYRILSRPDSGYRIIYRILSEKCNFTKAEEYLDTHEITDEKTAKELLDIMLVDANVLEDLVRNDADWKSHSLARLERLNARAAAGDKAAAKTLANAARIKDGDWNGNIREMFSVCNGSSSEKATNRNIKKFKDAGLIFMMFPRRVKAGQPVYATMFPAHHKAKVLKAKELIFKKEAE